MVRQKNFTKTVRTGWYNDEDESSTSNGDVVPNVEEHTQIIFFRDGSKKTITHIVRIDEGEFLTLTTKSNREFIVNKGQVNFTERFIESDEA
jgi:hypothetical protein